MHGTGDAGGTAEVGRFGGLLITMTVMLGVLSWISETGQTGMIVSLATTLVLMGAVYAVSRRRAHVLIGLSVAVPAFLTQWGWQLFEHSLLLSLNLGLMALFLSVTTWFVLDAIRSRRTVDVDTVMGGVCAYILMVMVFMYLHAFAEVTLPGSYLIHGEPMGDLSRPGNRFVEFFYFSMVTITTLGYGDIIPIRSVSRMLSGVEAFLGQLFVAIVIARLVSVAAVIRSPEQSTG